MSDVDEYHDVKESMLEAVEHYDRAIEAFRAAASDSGRAKERIILNGLCAIAGVGLSRQECRDIAETCLKYL